MTCTIFYIRLDKSTNKHLTVAKLDAAWSYVDLKCQQLRPLAKQIEYRQRTTEYAKQKGRFLSKEEFTSLFDSVVFDLSKLVQNTSVYKLYVPSTIIHSSLFCRVSPSQSGSIFKNYYYLHLLLSFQLKEER